MVLGEKHEGERPRLKHVDPESATPSAACLPLAIVEAIFAPLSRDVGVAAVRDGQSSRSGEILAYGEPNRE
jgi:hypothetical protein